MHSLILTEKIQKEHDCLRVSVCIALTLCAVVRQILQKGAHSRNRRSQRQKILFLEKIRVIFRDVDVISTFCCLGGSQPPKNSTAGMYFALKFQFSLETRCFAEMENCITIFPIFQ
jgi:hypothetical protein